MKKSHLLVGLALGLLLCGATTSRAQVSASLPDVTGDPGQLVTIPISFTTQQTAGIVGAAVRFNYDPSQLSFGAAGTGVVEAGTLTDGFSVNGLLDTPGLVTVTYFDNTGGDGITSDGVFVNIVAQISATASGGTTALAFDADNTEFETTAGLVSSTLNNGSLTVSNAAPVFTDQLGSQTISQGATLTFDYNATDADNDLLTYGLQNPPAGASINSQTGELTFTPTGTGTFDIIATVSDGTSVTTATTATITVEAGNTAPVFTSELPSQSLSQGGTLTFTYTATDADGNTLTYGLQSPPAGASINSQTGELTFTPTGTGTFDIIATVSDGIEVTTSSTAVITVTATNNAPVFTNELQSQNLSQGGTLTFTYTATDADGNTLTYSLQSPPAGASINSQTGELTFTPTGTGTFDIIATVSDGIEVTTSSTAVITVTAVNIPPTFTSELFSQTIASGATLTFTYTANDVNSDQLTFGLQNPPAGASINAQTGAFSFTPAGTGTFDIIATVSDGTNVTTSNTAVITVSSTNTPPVFTQALQDQQIEAGTALTFTYAATDADNNAVTYSLQGAPTGAAIDANTGAFTFTPVGTGAFQIVAAANDGTDVTTTSATITVVPQGQNNAPVFTSVLTDRTVSAGVTVAFQFQATDADNDKLTFALQQAPAGATIDPNTGQFAFTPTAAGTFTVIATVSDNIATATSPTATVTATQANNPPTFTTALPDTMITLGTTLNFTYQAADADGDALTFALASPPAGASINGQTGALAFTPAAVGTFPIVVTVSDGAGSAFTSATVTVAEAPANTPPVFSNQLEDQATTVGETISFDFDATDADNDALTFSLTNPPDGASINSETGAFTFTPTAAGSFDIIATVSDGTEAVSAPAATITVTASTGSTPAFTAVLGDQSLVLGRTLTFTFTATDPDNDALTFGLSNPPAGASINSQTGVFTFTPTAVGSFEVVATVSDGAEAVSAAPATITVVENAAPEFTSLPSAPSVAVGTAFAFTIEAADANGDALTFSLPTAPEGATIDEVTGALAFTPDAAGDFAFTVAVTDGLVTTTADFTLTAAAATEAPVANDDSLRGLVQGFISTTVPAPGVLGNDTDADTDLADLTAILVSETSGGAIVLNADGGYTYTPNPDFSGVDSFTYQASDGTNTSNTATVTIEVLPDEDRDGIEDEIEDGVDGDGDGQPDGDGNNDGIADRDQGNISSAPIDGDGDDYVTVAAPEGTAIVALSITSISPAPDAPDAPTAEEGLAFFDFVLDLDPDGNGTCEAGGNVDLVMPDGVEPNRYLKFGPTPDNADSRWYEFKSDGTTGTAVSTNAQGRTVLTLSFVDGARGDSDLTVNCRVADPGAAVFRPSQVDVEDEPETPAQFALLQNYPNPFNPTTTLAYRLATPADVELEVVNMLGQRVQLLVQERQAPGRYDVVFEAADLPSGIYLYRLTAGEHVAYKTMLLLK
ncbi:MAG: tandem-95 repeat protein [Bacteroidota bacterium]